MKHASIDELDRVAKQTFRYFAGPGKKNTSTTPRRGGIQSAALGGPAWPVPGDADIVNEVCHRLHEHESVDERLTQLEQAHARLLRAARTSPNLDQPCFKRANGETLTGRQRLELLAKHWTEHVEELKAAAAKTTSPQ